MISFIRTDSSVRGRDLKNDREKALEESILQASLREFQNNGYYQASVDRVADSIGIGKGTIYRHFGTKIRLFLSVVQSIFYQYGGIIPRLDSAESFESALELYLDALICVNREVGPFLRAVNFENQFAVMNREIEADPEAKSDFCKIWKQRSEAIRYLTSILERGIVEKKMLGTESAQALAELVFVTVNQYLGLFYSRFAAENPSAEPQDETFVIRFLKDYIYRGIGYHPVLEEKHA